MRKMVQWRKALTNQHSLEYDTGCFHRLGTNFYPYPYPFLFISTSKFLSISIFIHILFYLVTKGKQAKKEITHHINHISLNRGRSESQLLSWVKWDSSFEDRTLAYPHWNHVFLWELAISNSKKKAVNKLLVTVQQEPGQNQLYFTPTLH